MSHPARVAARVNRRRAWVWRSFGDGLLAVPLTKALNLSFLTCERVRTVFIHNTSDAKLFSDSLDPGCPAIQINSDTLYLESASDPTN